jgi:hypothetical protein
MDLFIQDAALLTRKMAGYKVSLCFGAGIYVFMFALHIDMRRAEAQDPTRLGRVLGNDHTRISATAIPCTLSGP